MISIIKKYPTPFIIASIVLIVTFMIFLIFSISTAATETSSDESNIEMESNQPHNNFSIQSNNISQGIYSTDDNIEKQLLKHVNKNPHLPHGPYHPLGTISYHNP